MREDEIGASVTLIETHSNIRIMFV